MSIVTFSIGVILLAIEQLFVFFLVSLISGIIDSPFVVRIVKEFTSFTDSEQIVTIFAVALVTSVPWVILRSFDSPGFNPEITVASSALAIVFLSIGLMKSKIIQPITEGS